jgi:hypothetical protein
MRLSRRSHDPRAEIAERLTMRRVHNAPASFAPRQPASCEDRGGQLER